MKFYLKTNFIGLIVGLQLLHGHKDHAKKPAMPAIGIVQGTIVDSISSKPIEYASVSLVELEHNELVTGGLSNKNGRLNITEIPLGKYAAIIEFIGYNKKEISPIILSPAKVAEFGMILEQCSSVSLL